VKNIKQAEFGRREIEIAEQGKTLCSFSSTLFRVYCTALPSPEGGGLEDVMILNPNL